MTESLGKLGPHEGQELELLLSGKTYRLFFMSYYPLNL